MLDSIIVRPGRPEDVDAAIAVWLATSTAHGIGTPQSSQREALVRTNTSAPAAFFVVADEEGRVVGMAVGTQSRADDGVGPPVAGICFISMVYVLPSHWGNGIGRYMVDALLAAAQSRGYTHTHLWTHSENARAHRLYEGRGFHRTGRTGTNDRGDPIVQYERALD